MVMVMDIVMDMDMNMVMVIVTVTPMSSMNTLMHMATVNRIIATNLELGIIIIMMVIIMGTKLDMEKV